jgi:hypothetical protein
LVTISSLFPGNGGNGGTHAGRIAKLSPRKMHFVSESRHPRKTARTCDIGFGNHGRWSNRSVRLYPPHFDLTAFDISGQPANESRTICQQQNIYASDVFSIVYLHWWAKSRSRIVRKCHSNAWNIRRATEPRNRHTSAVRRDGWSVYRATVDLPVVCENRLRRGPASIQLAHHVNVAHFTRRAIAIHDNRTGTSNRR